MTVYVVSTGSYSDWTLCGIFSTMANAEEAKKLYGSDNDIEEYELDDMPEHPQGMTLWKVSITKQGMVTGTDQCDCTESHFEWSNYSDHDQSAQFTKWARNIEHAVKIANERRTFLIAENRWVDSYADWVKLVDKGLIKNVSMPPKEVPVPSGAAKNRYQLMKGNPEK